MLQIKSAHFAIEVPDQVSRLHDGQEALQLLATPIYMLGTKK